MEFAPSPVHKLADGFGIPVFTPKSFRDAETVDIFSSLEADVAVVVAYGLSCRRRRSRRRRRAASTCTPRCCRAGAVRRRSSVP